MAQEAEGQRHSEFVGVKLTRDQLRELYHLANRQGVSRSEVLRRGLRREGEAAVEAG